MGTTLILVRHGAVDLDPSTMFDPPLSELGHAQARAVADCLARERIDAVYSSPLRRATETAYYLASTFARTLLEMDGLAEFDRYTGYLDFDALRASADPRYDSFARGDLSPWGVELEQFRADIMGTMTKIVESHTNGWVLVVTHGGVINVYLSTILGIPRPFFHRPAHTGVSRVQVGDRGNVMVETMNEHHHLQGVTT
jgi:probable phosphoglycerate mutase